MPAFTKKISAEISVLDLFRSTLTSSKALLLGIKPVAVSLAPPVGERLAILGFVVRRHCFGLLGPTSKYYYGKAI